MSIHFVKIAFRMINKKRIYSVINLLGLGTGMACCVLILLWVHDEISYDRFHTHSDSLYRIYSKWQSQDHDEKSALTSVKLAPFLSENYPEIIHSTRYSQENGKVIRTGDIRFENDIVAYTDADFFQMFSFPLLAGDSKRVFNSDYSLVMTTSMSEKYFGELNPIGQHLSIDGTRFTVTGVINDLRENTHFHFDCIVPFSARPEWVKRITEAWNVSAYYTYVRTQPGIPLDDLRAKIGHILQEKDPDSEIAVSLDLQSIRRIHLHHDITDYLVGHGNIQHVILFSALALVILIIACINFVNLSTARAGIRRKEIGLRKVVGAARLSLVGQFFGESLISTIFAFLLALGIIELSLPAFNQWSGKSLGILNVGILPLGLGCFIIILITGLLSGIYPAIVLSRFRPTETLKNTEKNRPSGATFRQVLVVLQFTLSALLVLSVIIIQNQISFMRNKPLGYDRHDLIAIQMRGDFLRNYQSIKAMLMQQPDILNVAGGTPPMNSLGAAFDVTINGRTMSDKVKMNSIAVDRDYPPTYGMEVLDGRNFRQELPENVSNGFIINETMARLIGIESPVGSTIGFKSYDQSIQVQSHTASVVGVIQDFHHQSMHSQIMPIIMYLNPDAIHYLTVRVKSGKGPSVLAHLKEIWNQYAADYPMEYHFIDQTVDDAYRTDQRLGEIVGLFTCMAIVISCLGLFALSAFMAERRAREIGIRKIVGASLGQIVKLLAWDYLKYVMTALIIALPLGYIIMSRWLHAFAYRIAISWTFILETTILSLIVAMTAVGGQAIKTALSNPVDALRYE